MEALMMTLLMVGVVAVLFQSNEEHVAVSTPEAGPVSSPAQFVRTITVTVDDKAKLADAINRIQRENTGNMFASNYIIGAPQITADGLTANISLFE